MSPFKLTTSSAAKSRFPRRYHTSTCAITRAPVVYPWVCSPGKAYFPTAVERAAAGQVLAGELNRFKRVVSKRIEDNQGAADKSDVDAEEILTNQGERDLVALQLGGFKALDQSVAATREVTDFCRVVELIKAKTLVEEALPKPGREGVAAAGKRERRGAADGEGARQELFEPSFLLILHSLEVGFLFSIIVRPRRSRFFRL